MDQQSGTIDAGDMDDESAQVAFLEVMRIWFNPDYERRLAAGTIDPSMPIAAAQALFGKDGTVIRLNDEVRGAAMGRLDRDIEIGEQLRWSDFKGIVSFELDASEVDYGHITMFRAGDDWRLFFNFLQGRSRADALAIRAENFLNTALAARANGWHDVAVDNLFSACELLAKADLIIHMLQGADSKSHNSVSSAINHWGKLGNVEAEFVKLLNKLGNLRHIARYEVSDLSRLILPGSDFDTVAAQVATVRDLCDHELRAEPRKPVRVTGILDPQSK